MKIIKIERMGDIEKLNHFTNKSRGTLLFSHPECPHCIHMKPQWEQVKHQLMRKKRPCDIFEIDGRQMQNIKHPLAQAVNGFPTILNVDRGKITPFEKERNVKNMLNFILSILPNKKNTVKFKKKIATSMPNNLLLNKERLMKKKRKTKSTNKPKKQKISKKTRKNRKTRKLKGGSNSNENDSENDKK